MKKIFLMAGAICAFTTAAIAQPMSSSGYVEEDYVITETPATNPASGADFQPLPGNKGVEVAPQPTKENMPASSMQDSATVIEIEE